MFGGLTFWVLSESQLKWYFKATLISSFCIFTVMFYSAIHTFLGWGARQVDMPDKVAIHWVIIKEPNKFKNFGGKIYILLTTFGDDAPRLHIYPWSEELEKQLQGAGDKQKEGVLVVGKIKKDKPSISRPLSNDEEWQFYEMPPNEFMPKDS